MKRKYKDLLGFEIEGLNLAKTDSERLEILNNHKELLEGLTSEAINSIDNMINRIKYPEILNEAKSRSDSGGKWMPTSTGMLALRKYSINLINKTNDKILKEII